MLSRYGGLPQASRPLAGAVVCAYAVDALPCCFAARQWFLGVLGVLQAGFFLTGRSRLFAACDCGARTARDRRCRAAMHLIWRKTRLRRDFRWQACG
jgi:hypothetical protein